MPTMPKMVVSLRSGIQMKVVISCNTGIGEVCVRETLSKID